ncbi:MAG: aspartate kinase [Firmicutes bacterium]|nr:aspartate kinase [Bacillota bacterium]
MKILVQKYGGTSVTTPEKRSLIFQRVKDALEEGFKVVLVVSAMGRDGAPYATDTLRALALGEYDDLSLRELDLIMSCGEIISAVVVAAFLSAKGLRACALTGIQAGFLTDGRYGEAEVVDCQPFRIKEILQLNEIPVVTGFQGADAQGEINTLGRGGSDTSAVILGAALDAERVEIYTDVSGIMTADPLIIKEARVIQQITYGEVCQLAYEGARVIHPRAVEVAMRNNVRVMVKSLENPGTGTLITTEASLIKGNYSTRGRRAVTGIAHETNLAQFLIELPIPDSSSELEIFRQIGEAGVNIDLISVFPLLKAFAVKDEHRRKVETILNGLKVPYRVEKDCAKVSVVGVGMHSIPGVMARVVKALNEHNIEIKQTGDSNITISLLIKQDDLRRAVQTLHDSFYLANNNGGDG